MAVGLPLKTTYANGDVYSAGDVNDITGTINLLGASVAYTAGKNRIINGDYRFNQRAFTSNTANNSFSFDRWIQLNAGTTGTLTVTPQTFSPGTAPVTGYEGINYLQAITAAGASADTYAMVNQKIEDVRTFANQAITVSFWAKAASGTPKISVEMEQNFGSGGSGGVLASSSAAATISTSWARYSFNVTVPSISGKTIGTSSYTALNIWLSAGSSFNSRANSIGLQNATFQIWGVQAEIGSTATAFQTASGSIQGELALCQRYYWRSTASAAYSYIGNTGYCASATIVYLPIVLQVPLRVYPTALEKGGQLAVSDSQTRYKSGSFTLASEGTVTAPLLVYSHGSSVLTQYRPYGLQADNDAATYVAFNAEL